MTVMYRKFVTKYFTQHQYQKLLLGLGAKLDLTSYLNYYKYHSFFTPITFNKLIVPETKVTHNK